MTESETVDKFYLAVPRDFSPRKPGMWASMSESDEDDEYASVEDIEDTEIPPNILIVGLDQLTSEEQVVIKNTFEGSDIGLISLKVSRARFDKTLVELAH